MSSYSRILQEHNANKSPPTQEQLDRIAVKQAEYEAKQVASAQATAAQQVVIKAQKRQQRLINGQQRLATKMGLSYAQWLIQARTYYSIDPTNFTVSSNARSANTAPETWACPDQISADEKILELIRYKYQDHFVKGHDFAW